MTTQRFEPIWHLISTKQLDVINDSITDDLKCVMCKRLLRDACVSTSCGCQYCYECINECNHLEKKYCPGDKEDCKDQYIIFGTNIFRSERLNKRISRLKVKCPNESCSSNFELIEMDEHLRVCQKLSMNCPFVAIGCGCRPIKRETLEPHLQTDNVTHTQSLIEFIENLKNEVNELKEEFAKSQLESRDKENRITSLEHQLNEEIETRQNVERQKMEEIFELKRQIEEVRIGKDAVETNVVDLRMKVDDSLYKNRLEVMALRKESMHKEDKVMSLQHEVSALKNEAEIKMKEILVTVEREISEKIRQRDDARMERDTTSITLSDLRDSSEGMKESRKMCDEEREARNDKCDQLCPNILGNFRWKIDNLSKKVDKYLYSESFYSDNYKLCLCLYLRSYYDNIYLYCYIMKGDNDDMVEWPMRRAVTLSIVDQVTMTAYKTEMYKYDTFPGDKSAFDKPTKDRNDYSIGTQFSSPFIKYSQIRNNLSIITKDSIVLCCNVFEQ